MCRGIQDQPCTGEPLAEVVVGITFEFEREPANAEGAKTLPGRAGEFEVNIGPVRLLTN